MTIKSVVSCTQHMQFIARLIRDRMVTEYTHDEYYEMLFFLAACNSRADTEGREGTVQKLSWSTSSRRYCVPTNIAASALNRKCNI